MKLYGGIETGGTKIVCAVGDEEGNIEARIAFPTRTPKEAMPDIFDFFDKYDLKAIGVGSFGPIDINKSSATYGYIMETPKLAWKNYNFVGTMKKHFPNILIKWTTDVNVAAFGEYKLGKGKGLHNICYVTVGTGVGVGLVLHDKVYHGYSHVEGGHILLREKPGDTFEGVCPYHKGCIEGMVSGPAIEKRAGVKGQDLKQDNSIWKTEAYYLAEACMTYTLAYAPDIIIFGGGVMKQEQLFPMIREEFPKLMNNYVNTPDLNKFITHVALGDNAGITGALLLAAE